MKVVVIALLILAFSYMAHGGPADARYPIAVEADGIERVDHHIYLDMRVWNCSDKPLNMDLFNLPWGGSLGRGLVIYQTYTQEVLRQVQPIEDFPERYYEIPPGKSVTGKIALDWYFPDLTKMKDVHNFVVFWVYQPLGQKGEPVGKKFGGMVSLDSERVRPSGENGCRPGVRP